MVKATKRNPVLAYILLLLAIVLVAVSIFSLPHTVNSDTGSAITGYAWSDNIGWISLNCATDPGGCSGAAGNWGLSADSNGNVTGYAWSDNIGWIKFGGLSSFPSGTGTSAQNAQIVSNNLIGWARACAGTAAGNCSSMTSRSDGWDGWISLYGSSPNYGLVSNTCSFSGYAWGSDVVGWIDFRYASMNGTVSDVYTCTNSTTINDKHTDASCNVTNTQSSCPTNAFCVNGSATCQYPQAAPAANGTLKVSPGIVSSGATTTVSWSIQNVTGCITRGSNVDGPWTGTMSGNTSSGTYSSSGITQQTTYTLTCVPLDPTQTFTESATVNVAPSFQEK